MFLTGPVARQTNRLNLLCMIVKLAFQILVTVKTLFSKAAALFPSQWYPQKSGWYSWLDP